MFAIFSITAVSAITTTISVVTMVRDEFSHNGGMEMEISYELLSVKKIMIKATCESKSVAFFYIRSSAFKTEYIGRNRKVKILNVGHFVSLEFGIS